MTNYSDDEKELLLQELEQKIAEAKRTLHYDYLDDEKIKEHIIRKSKTQTVHAILLIILLFISIFITIVLKETVMIPISFISTLIIGMLITWVPAKVLYYIPREKRLKEFAEQNWKQSYIFTEMAARKPPKLACAEELPPKYIIFF